MIQVENISYTYPGSRSTSALRGVSFTLKPGERVAMIGANGSGKSTMVKCLNAILLPQSGRVLVSGMLTSDEVHQFEIRKKVGMVFQNPDNQFVTTSVIRELVFGLENIGVPVKEMKKRIDTALHLFDLYAYRETPPHLLSGGEKQRVSMAAVWVMQPEYFILDEPTSLLDPRGRKQFMQQIILSGDTAKGVLFITQFPDEAMCFDRLLVMHQGKIVMDDQPGVIFHDEEKLHRMGLGVPVEYELNNYMDKLRADKN